MSVSALSDDSEKGCGVGARRPAKSRRLGRARISSASSSSSFQPNRVAQKPLRRPVEAVPSPVSATMAYPPTEPPFASTSARASS
jgi:hypothetical protein